MKARRAAKFATPFRPGAMRRLGSRSCLWPVPHHVDDMGGLAAVVDEYGRLPVSGDNVPCYFP